MSDDIKPDDVRAMRQRITRASYGRGERVDGKPEGYLGSGGGLLASRALRSAEYAGWSGEDAMTALAYHALVEYERLYDMLLQQAMLSTAPPGFLAGRGAKSAWIDRTIQEPDPNGPSIIVWDEGDIGRVVSAFRDYDSWLDAADRRDLKFRYWMPRPGSPYEQDYEGRHEAQK